MSRRQVAVAAADLILWATLGYLLTRITIQLLGS